MSVSDDLGGRLLKHPDFLYQFAEIEVVHHAVDDCVDSVHAPVVVPDDQEGVAIIGAVVMACFLQASACAALGIGVIKILRVVIGPYEP